MSKENTDLPEKKQKTNEKDRAFGEGFEYTHDNPYHERLGVFEEFVLRDDEAEANAGNWNEKAFKLDPTQKPATATLISPNNTNTTITPVYRWRPANKATYYYLLVVLSILNI